MFKTDITVALRHIGRNRGYSAINIFGLAVGMASCLLIMVWVQNELTYDRFHANGGRIYRVVQELTLNGRSRTSPTSSAMLGPAAVLTIPTISQAARIEFQPRQMVMVGTREFREDAILFADSSFFSLFSFPLRAGQAATALVAPNTAVLSQRTARKYFGSENPIGKTIRFASGRTYAINGVAQDPPTNSHLNFDIVCSFATWMEENQRDAQLWGRFGTSTYLSLAPGGDVFTALRQLNQLSDDNIGGRIKQRGGNLKVSLQPLYAIHLHSNFEGGQGGTGDIATVLLFSGVAVFILLIACVNFINLTTARFANRALEVGIKKTLGAQRLSLIRQFYVETFMVTGMATVLAVLMALLAMPWLTTVSGQEFSRALIFRLPFAAAIILLTLVAGGLAGIYPALYLSSFSPIQTLKGRLKAGAANAAFRKILVIGQFVISATLLIGTMTIVQQLDYIQNKNLGFNKNQVVVLAPPTRPGLNLETARHEFASIPGIVQASLSNAVPGLSLRIANFIPQGKSDRESLLMLFSDADAHLVPTLGLGLVQGRNFSVSMPTDPTASVLINETAAATLGWSNPLGKTISWSAPDAQGRRVDFSKRVIGVIKDYHTESLHQKIAPLVIGNDPQQFGFLSLRFAGGKATGIIDKLNATWHRLYSEVASDYFFLDEQFARMYQREEQLNQLFTTFALIAIFISCLGLFGLAAYMAVKRTREVGVRKVLGASTPSLVALLSLDFAKWVLIANFIAWPLAWLLMRNWLKNFAFHTTLSIPIFVLAGGLTLLLALATVSVQAIRAALVNPGSSLRNE
jgi:putative ABC transport system permease protein